MERQRYIPKGRIITFYSYKGGTGRSMALANIAWILALSGKRVLVVDWDLEAPGVHRYFHPFLEDKELAATDGLLDFVEKLAGRAAASSSPLKEEEVDVMEYITMLKWPAKSSLRWENFGEQAGIDLLPAGRQGPSYGRKLGAFNWIDFYQKLGGRRLLQIVRQQIKDVYDYVLIDSRTGVSDTSGICTVEMPDTLVVCFTLNDQSILGASGIVESVLAQRKELAAAAASSGTSVTNSTVSPTQLPFRVFPVPMRVEIVGERTKRQVALALAQQKFAAFIEHVPREERSRYWGRVQVAYFPFYAFEEIPAVFGDPANEELSLTTPIKRIARFVADDDSLKLVPLAQDDEEAERLRREVLSWYLRRGPGGPQDAVELAQATYDQLSRENQKLMKRVMLRLVQVAPGSPPIPITVPIGDFSASLQDIVGTLAKAGVVQIRGTSVFIADRKIVEEWDCIRQWLKEDTDFLLIRQNVGVVARSWALGGRENSGLLRGELLEDAVHIMETRPDDLNEPERSFIAASKKQNEEKPPLFSIRIPGTSRRLRIFRRAFYVTLIVVLVVLGVATGLTVFSVLNHRKERAARGAAIVSLAQQQYSQYDALLSAQLLSELSDYDASEADRKFALQVAGNTNPEEILTGSGSFHSMEFSHDGKLLVTAGDAGVELWDTAKWTKIRSLGTGAVNTASLNGWFPDRAKQRGASGQTDRIVTTKPDGTMQIWDLDGRQLMVFSGANLSASFFSNCLAPGADKKLKLYEIGQLTKPIYARFVPDETVVMVAYANGALVMIAPATGRCFDVYNPHSSGHAAFSPDGEWVANVSSPIAASGRVLRLFHVQDWKEEIFKLDLLLADQYNPDAVSFDKRTLFLGYQTNYVESPSGPLVRSAGGGSMGNFSWDGKYIVAASSSLVDWSPIGADKVQGLARTSQITAVAFDSSGKHVLTASTDKTVRIWPTQKTPPNPLSTWPQLIAYLKNSTSICLTVDQRKQLLNEDAATAQKNVQACEDSHK